MSSHHTTNSKKTKRNQLNPRERRWHRLTKYYMPPVLPLAHYKLMSALLLFADADGVCWPNQRTLAEICRTTPYRLRKMITALTERGLVKIVSEAGDLHDSATYRVRVPAPKSESRGTSAEGGTNGRNSRGTNQTQRGTKRASRGTKPVPPKGPCERATLKDPKERSSAGLDSLALKSDPDSDPKLIAKRLEEAFGLPPRAAHDHAKAFLAEWSLGSGCDLLKGCERKLDAERLQSPTGYVISVFRDPKKASQNGLAKYLPKDFQLLRRPRSTAVEDGAVEDAAFWDVVARGELSGDPPTAAAEANDDPPDGEDEEVQPEPVPSIKEFAEGEVWTYVSPIRSQDVYHFRRRGSGWLFRGEKVTDAERRQIINKGYIQ